MNKVAAVAALGLVLVTGTPLARGQGQEQPPGTAPNQATGKGPGAAPGGLDKPPRLVRFIEAQAPPALTTREHAEVILIIDVDERGTVGAVKVETPIGDGFDEAALAAAQQFVFEPGESGGKPVPVRITYRYRFALKPPPATPPTPPAASDNGATAGDAATAATPAGPSAPLSGYVRHKGDRVPLGGVVVILDTGEKETVTDAEGRFNFDAVAVGEHAIKLRGGDIVPADTKVKVNAGKSLEVSLYVMGKERYVSTVRADKVVVETVEQTLAQEEIKRIPGTQGDTLKAVQNLPGVARAPFGLGQLVVWGSRPQDTRTYVDGVFIPTLYHFGGLRSTVNSEMVNSLSFTPGAYGAERGLGLGGLVEVATRTPRTDGYHGYVQLDLLDGSFMVEGPLGKKVSFAVAARRSWLDVFLPLFTKNSGFQLSPTYADYQARLTYRPTSRDDLSLFIFGSDDQLTLKSNNDNPELAQQFNSHTYYVRGLASWLHRFAKGATLSTVASVGYDVPFQVQVQSPTGAISTDAHLLSYTLRAMARVPVASFLRVDAGVDYEGNYFTLDQSNSAAGGGQLALAPNNLTLYTNHIAPVVTANFSLFSHRLTITPQFRLQLFTFLGYPGTTSQFSTVYAEPDPRVQVRYQALPWFAVKAAFGLFHQAPQTQSLSALTGNPQLGPESALHYVLGVEFLPMAKLHINAEGFYKDLRDLVVTGQSATDPRYLNAGLGRVYGGEILVRLETWKNLFGWASYTVLRSERLDHPGEDWHLFQNDQTHILTLLASYKLPRGFQVGLRFRYVTGNPTTPILGASYDSNADRYVPQPGAPYSDRLGSFNQLDLRVDKEFTFNRWKLSLYLDIQNVYNASNAEAVTYNFNYKQQNTISGLPILPVIGIRGDL